MKKKLGVLVLVFAVLGVSGVWAGGNQESTSKATNSTQASSSVGGTISVITSANSGRPGLEATGPMFEKKTGATVKREFGDMGTPTYTAKLMTELQNGTAPDIFGVFPGSGTSSPNLGTIVDAGYAMDLSNTEYGKNAWQGLADAIKINGKVYSVCLGVQFSGIIYNTKLFSQYNLQVPTDWAQLLQLVAKIRKVAPGKIPVAMAGGNTAMAMIAALMFIVNEPDFTTNITSFSSSDAYRNGLQKILDLQAAHGFSPSVGTDSTNAVVTQMVSNQAFMLIDLTSRYGAIKRADPSAPLGYAPFVADKKSDAKMMLWPGTNMAVNAKTKNPATAIAFINYITTPAVNKDWVQAAGGAELTPAEATGKAPIPEAYKALAAEAATKSVMIPAVTWNGPGAANALGNGISGLLSGTTTITAVLAKMDAANKK